MKTGKKVLITSALPYVNAVPHLGNIIGCVLSADVFARFSRSRGNDTLYICGSDEHGTTTEVKAMEEGLTPKQICDKYHAIHADIYKWFNISFDYYGRTSSLTHHKITQDIFLKLHENGFIAEDFLDELYCNTCKKSLADRFVEGTCPHCGYENARGDQCDKCGHMINPFELKNPKCKVCGNPPVKKTVKHLFLDLPKLENEIDSWVEVASTEGEWSENTIQYTRAWLREGLKKRCISRELKWGIPIPLKGFEHMVFYVWFDAPIGYISITADHTKDWKNWWNHPEEVKLYQFMGKDNVPFHTILFPGTELGTREKYTMVHHLSTTEFLNYEDAKFSKSRGTGVFGDDAKSTGIPSDVYRYYLLINRPEKSDTVFSWDDFQEKLNAELLANLGNLVNRTLVFISKYYDSKIPEAHMGPAELELISKAKDHYAKITQLLDHVKIKDALKETMAFLNVANKYFQDSQPWKTVKEDKARADASMYVLANIVKDTAILIEPFLPDTSRRINEQLNIKQHSWKDLGVTCIKPSHAIGKPEALFAKLENEQKEELKKRFGEKKEEKPKKSGLDLLNLKVARIIHAEPHPKADKLMIIKLDLGQGEERQIVSGIREHYTSEDLVGKKIIVVYNLKPATLRGVESRGMLLACTNDDGKLGLLTVDEPAGTVVHVKGHKENPDEITIDEFLSVGLSAKNKHAFAEGKQLFALSTPVTIDKDVEGKVR
jgi:methionyl-tRNA synthetase